MTTPVSSKFKFVREYSVNASSKILYPYLSTPSGLARWFCESVKVLEGNRYNFIWDKTSHLAEISNHRTNRSIRFIFLGEDGQPVPDADYLDFTIETSELTGEQFLRVTDYSADQEATVLEELWDTLIQSLRELIGG